MSVQRSVVAALSLLALATAAAPAVAADPATTRTTVVTNRSTSIYNHALHVTARIRNPATGGYVTEGTVTFFADGETLGSAEVVPGVFPGLYVRFHAGTHSLTASYSGTANYAGSESVAVSHTVAPGAAEMRITGQRPNRIFVRVEQVAPFEVHAKPSGLLTIAVDDVSRGTINFRGGKFRIPRSWFTRGQSHSIDVEFSNPFGDWNSDSVTDFGV